MPLDNDTMDAVCQSWTMVGLMGPDGSGPQTAIPDMNVPAKVEPLYSLNKY